MSGVNLFALERLNPSDDDWHRVAVFDTGADAHALAQDYRGRGERTRIIVYAFERRVDLAP